MEGLTRLRLPTHPSTHPTPLPPTPLSPTHPTPLLPMHPLQHAIPDITVAVKKVAQNPAVLASWL